jgi:hypothetical protein
MEELLRLRVFYPSLDMAEAVIREIATPYKDPSECVFARTTHIVSADLKTKVTPCQFGGDPDCEQCGCIATLGLAAIGHHRVAGPLTAGHLFNASELIGKRWRSLADRSRSSQTDTQPFHILNARDRP